MGQGRVVVLTGPSGVGKGTLLRSLLAAQHPEVYLSVSATTRPPRPGEVEGQSYYFMDRETFTQLVQAGEFLEWAEFAGNLYGTPRRPVQEKVDGGYLVILEIELEGARQVRQTFPEAQQIFLLPPSLEELEARIRNRGQDPEAAIARRLAKAATEIEAADEFDIRIVNDKFEAAAAQLAIALFGDSEQRLGSPAVAEPTLG